MLRVLAHGADSFDPTTARSPASLSRLQLASSDGAIVDFGATVVHPDGSLDVTWAERMQADAAYRNDGADLARLEQYLRSRVTHELHVEKRELPCGVLAFINYKGVPGKSAGMHQYVTGFLRENELEAKFYLHITDRDVTVLPSFVSKSRAVQHVIATRGWAEDLLIGAGDSLSDCPFIAQLDFAIIPTASRAFTALHEQVRQRRECPSPEVPSRS